MRQHSTRFDRSYSAVTELELPTAVFKTCPWQPRELVETGLRQWLRCCAAALRDEQVIGMPSRAVDEAWHGLILCTARYQAFCDMAYGKFMHHHPVGGAPAGSPAATDRWTSDCAELSSRGRWLRCRANSASCGISTAA